MPAGDVPAILDAAWRSVNPEFDLVGGTPMEAPSIAGLRPFTLVEYQGAPARDEATGESSYVTATPPIVGFRMVMREEGETQSLVLHDPGSTEVYVFAPASRSGAM